jgi:hypothetical protein
MEAAGYETDSAGCADAGKDLATNFSKGKNPDNEDVYKFLRQCWVPTNPVARFFHDWELQNRIDAARKAARVEKITPGGIIIYKKDAPQ